jgi:YVTN family beta-propeller protein
MAAQKGASMNASIVRLGLALLIITIATAPAVAQRTVYVTHLGGAVTIFLTGSAGELTFLETLSSVGNSLRGIAIAPNGRAAYIVDSDLATITAFSIGEDGRLTALGPSLETDPHATVPPTAQCEPAVTTPISPCPFGVAVSPNGRQVYVTNSESNTVSVFRVHDNGRLTPMGAPVPAGGIGPRGLAISPNGERLYVVHRNTDSVSVFAVAPNGMLTLRGPAVQLQGCTPTPATPPTPQCSPFWTSITPDGRWLYVTNFISDDAAIFAIDSDGGLTEVDRPNLGGRPESIVMTSDMRFLYVGLIDDNVVRAFIINDDGTLQPNGSFPVCEEWQTPAACGAVSLGMAPDDRTVYAVTTFQPVNEALSFEIAADGTLTPLGAVPTGGLRPQFQALSIRPNQGPVASLRRPGAAGRVVRFDASESLDPDGQVARYDWDFGDGQTLADGGPTPIHAYAQAGQYRVTVKVVDQENCSDRFIFVGQTATCNGGRSAVSARMVDVSEH